VLVIPEGRGEWLNSDWQAFQRFVREREAAAYKGAELGRAGT
jgi:hypothetical protein